jgi:DeoR/GlpR family transcriptional regulator of sugar metabolism
VTALRSLHVDVLFMGVHGMTVDSGFPTPNLLEAETNQALIASAERLAVVVDHTKWDVRGLSRMAHLGDAQVLVTDDGLAPDAQTVLSEHVGRLIVAPAGR